MFNLSWWNNLQFPVSLLCIVLQECQSGSVQPAVKIVPRTFEEKDCAMSPCSQTCLPDTLKGKKKGNSRMWENPQDCVLWERQVEMLSVAEKLGQCQIKLQEPCSRHRLFRWCRYWAQGAVTAWRLHLFKEWLGKSKVTKQIKCSAICRNSTWVRSTLKLGPVAKAEKVSHVLVLSLLCPMDTSRAAGEDGAARPLSDLAGCSGGDLVARAEPEPYFRGNSMGASWDWSAELVCSGYFRQTWISLEQRVLCFSTNCVCILTGISAWVSQYTWSIGCRVLHE